MPGISKNKQATAKLLGDIHTLTSIDIISEIISSIQLVPIQQGKQNFTYPVFLTMKYS